MRRLAPLLLLLASRASTTTTAPDAGRRSAPCNPGHSILNATLWVQSSAEYRAAAMQTFAAARRALDEALADPSRVGAIEETNEDPAQPPAIILDVDETVLDNTPFEARVIQHGHDLRRDDVEAVDVGGSGRRRSPARRSSSPTRRAAA